MDVLLVGFICGFIWGGWRTGFLRRLAGLGFIAISVVLSVFLRQPFGALIHGLVADIPASYAELWAYLLVFPVALIGLHLVVGRTLKGVAVQGVSRELDAGLGAAFGAVEAVLILSVVAIAIDVYAAKSLPTELAALRPMHDWVESFRTATTTQLLDRTTIPVLASVVQPLLPSDISAILHNVPGAPGQGIPGLPNLPLPGG
jgi:uncharacterized membrane protein required for colicin V production